MKTHAKEVMLLNNLTEEDAIFDALKVAKSNEIRFICMQYLRLKQQCLKSHAVWTMQLMNSSMPQVRKSGLLWKKGSGLLARW
jgi:hypothetical protein